MLILNALLTMTNVNDKPINYEFEQRKHRRQSDLYRKIHFSYIKNNSEAAKKR